jgi:Pyruvate/2-oxoacid:ferredoxin oxidoreductase delta subunit
MIRLLPNCRGLTKLAVMPLTPALRIVLHEGAGAQPLDAQDRFATISGLLERGYTVTSSKGDSPVTAAGAAPSVVLGHFAGASPRFAQAGAELPTRDISGLNSVQIADAVETERAASQSAKHGEWKPWFPVIDYDRCTNCMQCLSFCLFGVYGVDAGKRIQVQNNDNCKTNCPACSRVCPEAAIMFRSTKRARSTATW